MAPRGKRGRPKTVAENGTVSTSSPASEKVEDARKEDEEIPAKKAKADNKIGSLKDVKIVMEHW